MSSRDVHCAIDFPLAGDTVTGVLNSTGRAWSDNGQIDQVELSIDGTSGIIVNGTEEWYFELNTSQLEDGEHSLTAMASCSDIWSNPSELKLTVLNGPGEDEDNDDDDDGFLAGPSLLTTFVAVGAVVLTLRPPSRSIPERP